MNYSCTASSKAHKEAAIQLKSSEIAFGIIPEEADSVPNPAELLLGALSACILKNVERFSSILHYTYSKAEITLNATRNEKPPKMEHIHYQLTIYSSDEKFNVALLKKNIEHFGTIYNTLKASCVIEGTIEIKDSI